MRARGLCVLPGLGAPLGFRLQDARCPPLGVRRARARGATRWAHCKMPASPPPGRAPLRRRRAALGDAAVAVRVVLLYFLREECDLGAAPAPQTVCF